MKSLNATLKSLIVISGLCAGVSLTAMQKAQELLPTIPKSEWYRNALEAKISSPLKVETINKTGGLIRSIQQGQSKDYWYANTPDKGKFADEKFNMDAWTKEGPQYLFLTDQNHIYVLNFEKKPTYFKAILEKLAVRLKPGSINKISANELIKLSQIVERDLTDDIDEVKPGQTLHVTLEPDVAYLELTAQE